MGVQNLPTIVTIYKGQVLDNWQGVKSDDEIDEGIARYEAASGKINPKRALATAFEFLQAGHVQEAEALYSKLAEDESIYAQATAGLAMVAIARKDIDGAQAMMEALK